MQPRLLVLGAHPDDAELHAGGLMALYREHGWPVKVVSASNGDAGHQTDFGPGLAARRADELRAALGVIGAECEIWEHHDGLLQPTSQLRDQVISVIRRYQPDLVLTHRTCDYHPDHRALAQAVQDASYLVTVPAIVPAVPHLRRDPVVAFMTDHFTRPNPLRPDVVLAADGYLDTLVEMAHLHTSQVYEWLPYNRAQDLPPPADDPAGRKEWLRRAFIEPRWSKTADRFRTELHRVYGPKLGAETRFAEAYEISEYASQPNAAERARLFPWLPEPE